MRARDRLDARLVGALDLADGAAAQQPCGVDLGRRLGDIVADRLGLDGAGASDTHPVDMGSAVIHRVLGDAHPGHRQRQRAWMRITAQPIEVAVVVQQTSWAGIAEELAIGEAAPLGHKHVFAAQRFAAGAGKTENPPVVNDFECGDRQQKAAARATAGPHPSLPRKRGRVREGAGVRSSDEPGAVITAARVTPKAADEVAAVNALEAADRRQRTGGERARIVAPDLLLRALGEISNHGGVRTEHRVDPAAGATRARDLVVRSI